MTATEELIVNPITSITVHTHTHTHTHTHWLQLYGYASNDENAVPRL